MSLQSRKPPFGIKVLSIFLLTDALISFAAGVALFVPGRFLEPLWRLNPRGHDGLIRIGLLGLRAVVCSLCVLRCCGC